MCFSLFIQDRNYLQIENEALSIIFRVTSTYMAIFTLVTDHKPLISILGPKSHIPPLAAA